MMIEHFFDIQSKWIPREITKQEQSLHCVIIKMLWMQKWHHNCKCLWIYLPTRCILDSVLAMLVIVSVYLCRTILAKAFVHIYHWYQFQILCHIWDERNIYIYIYCICWYLFPKSNEAEINVAVIYGPRRWF